MPTRVNGDFSSYPEELRDVFPYLYGEACSLREAWEVYHHLFMSRREHTEMLGKYMGPLLGVLQNLLQDEMFMSIARLIDKDNRSQKNLTLWTLLECCRKWDYSVADELEQGILVFETKANLVKLHRHKRLAHYDLDVSMDKTHLPVVTFSEIKSALDTLENAVALVAMRAANTTIVFSFIRHSDITWPAEKTVHKAQAYDELEKTGIIPQFEWKKYWKPTAS